MFFLMACSHPQEWMGVLDINDTVHERINEEKISTGQIILKKGTGSWDLFFQQVK
jgi:hypothetical protein